MDSYDDGVEDAAQFLERRADEIEKGSSNVTTGRAMANVYRAEAKAVRILKNRQGP